MSYFCFTCRKPAARVATICGMANIITIAITIVVARSIFRIWFAKALAAGAALFSEFLFCLSFCCLLFSYMGMNEEAIAPSARTALKRCGNLYAKMKASAMFVAPRVIASSISRRNPKILLMMVQLAKIVAERSRGIFWRRGSGRRKGRGGKEEEEEVVVRL